MVEKKIRLHVERTNKRVSTSISRPNLEQHQQRYLLFILHKMSLSQCYHHIHLWWIHHHWWTTYKKLDHVFAIKYIQRAWQCFSNVKLGQITKTKTKSSTVCPIGLYCVQNSTSSSGKAFSTSTDVKFFKKQLWSQQKQTFASFFMMRWYNF